MHDGRIETVSRCGNQFGFIGAMCRPPESVRNSGTDSRHSGHAVAHPPRAGEMTRNTARRAGRASTAEGRAQQAERPERASEGTPDSSASTPPLAACLILVEANSATHGCDCVSFFVT
jgi:hypothetical protein